MNECWVGISTEAVGDGNNGTRIMRGRGWTQDTLEQSLEGLHEHLGGGKRRVTPGFLPEQLRDGTVSWVGGWGTGAGFLGGAQARILF